MPEIKQYTRQTRATGFVQRQNTQGAFGEGTAQALNEAGDFLGKMAIKKAKSDYIAKMSQFELDNIRRQEELSNMDFEPDVDLSEVYQKDLEVRAAELDIHPLMSDQWQSDLTNLKLNFAANGLKEGARREAIRVEENWKNTVTNIENFVAMGGSRERANQMINEAASTLPNMPKEEREVLINSAKDGMITSEAKVLLSSNPRKFLELSKQGYFNDLPNLVSYSENAKNQIIAENKRIAAERKEFNMLRSGLLDPSSKKHKAILDDHFQKITSPSGEALRDSVINMTPEGGMLATEFVKKYKIIPETLQSDLRGMMNGGDLEQKEYAYNLVGRMVDTGAVGFSESEISKATSFNSLMSVGYSNKSAMEQIDVLQNSDYQRIKDANLQKFNESKIEINAEQSVKNIFGEGWFNLAPDDVSVLAQSDYASIFKNEFLKFGDEAQARDVANKIISERYGQTEITGSEVIMRHPPEKFGSPMLDEKENREWMQNELKKSLKELGYGDDVEKYSLQGIPENDEYTQYGIPPRYLVIDPETGDYVRDKDNDALTIYFDPSVGNKIAGEKMQREIKKKTERYNREAAQRIINQDPNLSYIDKWFANRANDLEDVKDFLGIGED